MSERIEMKISELTFANGVTVRLDQQDPPEKRLWQAAADHIFPTLDEHKKLILDEETKIRKGEAYKFETEWQKSIVGEFALMSSMNGRNKKIVIWKNQFDELFERMGN
jgi:hypothetical protein